MKNIITIAMTAMTVILSGCYTDENIDNKIDDSIEDKINNIEAAGIITEYGINEEKNISILKSFDIANGGNTMSFYGADGEKIDITGKEIIIFSQKNTIEKENKYIVNILNNKNMAIDSVVAYEIYFSDGVLVVYTKSNFIVWNGEFEVTELQIAK